jgi:hypothetical protein
METRSINAMSRNEMASKRATIGKLQKDFDRIKVSAVLVLGSALRRRNSQVT